MEEHFSYICVLLKRANILFSLESWRECEMMIISKQVLQVIIPPPYTLLDFVENVDNFEARTGRVNFGLFQSNNDFT